LHLKTDNFVPVGNIHINSLKFRRK
jgi:hypothetical protein